MSIPIKINVYASAIKIPSSQEKNSVNIELENTSSLRGACMDWAGEVARVSRKWRHQEELGETELEDALRTLTTIGQKITHAIFNGRWKTVRDLFQQHPETDIRVVGSDNRWIPWELLYFGDSEKLSLQNFLGFKRNIYRVPSPWLSQGRKLEIVPHPSVGFLGHDRVPLTVQEFEILGNHSISGKIDYQGRAEFGRERGVRKLFNWLKPLNVIHFAGLIAPVQYLEESLILVNTNFWLSFDDFNNTPPFSFTAAPLVILNVRDNYSRSPELILKYINLLLKRGAGGVIASEFPIPPTLAEQFARQFYNSLFEEGQSISQALASTKKEFLEKYNNPFAMFYAPYFEPMFEVRKGGSAEKSSNYTKREIEAASYIRELVRKDQLKEAIKELSNIRSYQREADQLSRRLSGIQTKKWRGTIPDDKAEAEYAQIAEAILDLISWQENVIT